MYLYTICMPGALGSQKKVSDPLRLVLHLVVSSRVAVRNLKERPVLVTTEPYLWLHEFAS